MGLVKMPSSTTIPTQNSAYDYEQPTTPKLSLLPQELWRSHIFPLLDVCSLASLGCVTPDLRTLITSDKDLWTHLCNSTWPSTATPRLRQLISSSPDGAYKFFSQSFPPLSPELSPNPHPLPSSLLPQEIISAVDIFYRGECFFSKVHEHEIVRSSPFRVDLLEPNYKESVPTPIRRTSLDDLPKDLFSNVELSWILVHPTREPGFARMMNVSSSRPVSIERSRLSGKLYVRFAVVVEHVMFRVDITFVGLGSGGLVLHVVEACLRIEDSGGDNLNGRDSMNILRHVLVGKRKEMRGREVEETKRYLEYVERKKELEDKRFIRKERLTILFVVFGVVIFTSLFRWYFVIALLLACTPYIVDTIFQR